MSPGLSTLVELTMFEGCCCVALAPASAIWSVVALKLSCAAPDGAADGSGGLNPSARAFPARASAHRATAGMTERKSMRRSRWAPLGAAGIVAVVVWNTAKTVPDCVSLFQHEFRNPILDRELIVKVIDLDLIALIIETAI